MLTSAFLLMTSSTIRDISKIRYLVNRLSEKSGWPLVGTVLKSCIQILRTILKTFCSREHFFRQKQCKMTSFEVRWRHYVSRKQKVSISLILGNCEDIKWRILLTGPLRVLIALVLRKAPLRGLAPDAGVLVK